MPDLLFISDNPKVEQIKVLLQPMLKLEIVVTPHVERALEEISGRRPSVICIQAHLAGTTAGEIAGRIRTAPETTPPLFVLLREGDDDAVPPEQPFAHAIDLSQPVEQLAKSILRVVLRPAFRLRWSDIYIHRNRDESAWALPDREEAEPAEATAAPPKIQIPAELLKAFEHNYHSRHRNRWIRYAIVSLAACLAVFGWYLTSGRHEQSADAPQAPAARPTVQGPTVQRPAVQRPAAAPVPKVVKVIPATPPAPAVAVVQKALSAPRKPVASKAPAAALPSFLPEKGRDSAYSRLKPGWERYTDANHEFRILRSGGRIKAVQVLAATQHAISEAFLKSVLGEIAGSSTYRETSQEEEHGFLIKRGSAGAHATVLIYTQKSRIRAFVITVK